MNKAKLYNRANNLQRRDAELVIEEYGHLLEEHSDDDDSGGEADAVKKIRLLDIGCGSGDVLVDFLLPLIRGSGHIVGADLSPEMVRFGRERYAKYKDTVSFDQLDIAGDVTAFLQSYEPFDHVTSFYCLHWVQNQQLAMHNVAKLLKPNGNCLLAFIGQMPIFEIYERMARTEKWAEFMHDVSGRI